MRSPERSARITSLLIKIFGVLCIASLFVMPYAAELYEGISIGRDIVTVPLLVTFYLCAAFGFVILWFLNKLMDNILSEKIFVEENVKYMSVISYCCFAIAVVTLIFARLRILVFVVTFAAAFIGLILRVIKNCFTKAIILREENDYTI